RTLEGGQGRGRVAHFQKCVAEFLLVEAVVGGEFDGTAGMAKRAPRVSQVDEGRSQAAVRPGGAPGECDGLLKGRPRSVPVPEFGIGEPAVLIGSGAVRPKRDGSGVVGDGIGWASGMEERPAEVVVGPEVVRKGDLQAAE